MSVRRVHPLKARIRARLCLWMNLQRMRCKADTPSFPITHTNTRRTDIRKSPTPANILPSAAAGNGLPSTGQPLSSVSGRKRYNTLDFASKIVCQQGCSAPLLETSRRGISSLWTPVIFFTRWYPNCKNAVCHRREENTKGSICARIVGAQIFLFVLII